MSLSWAISGAQRSSLFNQPMGSSRGSPLFQSWRSGSTESRPSPTGALRAVLTPPPHRALKEEGAISRRKTCRSLSCNHPGLLCSILATVAQDRKAFHRSFRRPARRPSPQRLKPRLAGARLTPAQARSGTARRAEPVSWLKEKAPCPVLSPRGRARSLCPPLRPGKAGRRSGAAECQAAVGVDDGSELGAGRFAACSMGQGLW